MSRNVYVGNLPYRLSEADLAQFFGQDGRAVVSVHLVMDRETGRPRGFGFVEFQTEAMAASAVSGMDGRMLEGRPLKVSLARPREGGGMGGPPRRPLGGGPYGGPPRDGPPGDRQAWAPRVDRPPGDRPGGWAPRGDGPGGPGDRPGDRPGGPPRPGGGFARPGGGFGRPGGGFGGGFGAPPAPATGWGDARPQRTPGARRRAEPDFDEERGRKAADWERKKGRKRWHDVADDDIVIDDE